MRIVLFIIAFSSLLACTKEDSFFVPIHASSYAWAMENTENKTHIYSNSVGDSLRTGSISEVTNVISEGYSSSPGYPEGTSGQSFRQTIAVDTIFEYSTSILSSFFNQIRDDQLWINGLGVSMRGFAYPAFSIADANYMDTLRINGFAYPDVYHKMSSNQNTGIYVNVYDGLVAFIIEKDTFNLVN